MVPTPLPPLPIPPDPSNSRAQDLTTPSPDLPFATPTRLLDGLNGPQREAVETMNGPLLVLAGPGSGKTRVLTHRIAYLIGPGRVPPWQVMAVTFTNKASRVMGERLEPLVGKAALQQLTLGTFHAICARVLRREAGTAGLGFDQKFVIYDTDDQLKVVKNALAALNLDEKTYRPQTVLGTISNAKNELIRPEQFAAPTYWYEVAGRVYKRYQEFLRANNALDFDDLLMETATLLTGNTDVQSRYRERYRFLLVDEFQDTNTAQYVFLKALAAAEDPDAPHNIFVVGDEDQSIYRWRGADYRNILRFRQDFPATHTILLEQNYRSTQTILDAARAVIDVNAQRTRKALWTESGHGSQLTVFEAYDENEEAAWVVRTVEQHVAKGSRYGDFAVMYRTNAQSRSLEDTLVRHRLPYQLVGATRFYERREIKDVLAYLRFIFNPFDEIALERIINVPPRNVGPKAWQTLRGWADVLGVPMWDALQLIAADSPETLDLGDDALAGPGSGGGPADSSGSRGTRDPGHHAGLTAAEIESLGLPPVDTRGRNALGGFYDIMRTLLAARDTLAAPDVLDLLLNVSGYTRWLRDGSEEGEERWENVQELRGVALDFALLPPGEALGALLESVALVSETDSLSESADRITLLTLHAAKGLEFPMVFITGLEEGTLPHSRSFDDPEGMAEERRLFYVGLTRAEKKLYLVHAYRRTVFGNTDTRIQSRFLKDLPLETLDASSRPRRTTAPDPTGRLSATLWPSSSGSGGGGSRRGEPGSARPAATGRPAAPASPGTAGGFRPGDRVRHATFGNGVVVSSIARDGDEEVTVAFAGLGVKKMIQSFAKLERV